MTKEKRLVASMTIGVPETIPEIAERLNTSFWDICPIMMRLTRKGIAVSMPPRKGESHRLYRLRIIQDSR